MLPPSCIRKNKSKEIADDMGIERGKESISDHDVKGKGDVEVILHQRRAATETLDYCVATPPTDSPRMFVFGNASIVEKLKAKLSIEQLALFKNTCFGVFLGTSECSLQPQMLRCFMVHEVEQDKLDEFWIHINGTTLKFTIREFATITGLRCTGNTETFDVPRNTPNRLIRKYFNNKAVIRKNDLVDCFENKKWGDNDEEAVKIAILYFINTYLSSIANDITIPRKHFHMVENGSFTNYPWGKDAFTQLIASIRHKMKIGQQLYRINGMPLAMQVWLYECCSKVPRSIAVRVGSESPQILNWKTKTVKLQYAKLMEEMFKDHDNQLVFMNMTSTPKDVMLNQFSDTMVSPSEVHATDQMREEDFDDFSSAPPKLGKRRKQEPGVHLVNPSKKAKTKDHPHVAPGPSKKPKSKDNPDVVPRPSKKRVWPSLSEDVQAEDVVQFNEQTPTKTPVQPVQAATNVHSNEQSHTESDSNLVTRKDLNDFKKSVDDHFLNMRIFIRDQITRLVESWTQKSQPESEKKGQGVASEAPHCEDNQTLNRRVYDTCVTPKESAKETNKEEDSEMRMDAADYVPREVNREVIPDEPGSSFNTKELQDIWASYRIARDLPYCILLDESSKCKYGVEHYSPNQFARQFDMTQAVPFHQSANKLPIRSKDLQSADYTEETESRQEVAAPQSNGIKGNSQSAGKFGQNMKRKCEGDSISSQSLAHQDEPVQQKNSHEAGETIPTRTLCKKVKTYSRKMPPTGTTSTIPSTSTFPSSLTPAIEDRTKADKQNVVDDTPISTSDKDGEEGIVSPLLANTRSKTSDIIEPPDCPVKFDNLEDVFARGSGQITQARSLDFSADQSSPMDDKISSTQKSTPLAELLATAKGVIKRLLIMPSQDLLLPGNCSALSAALSVYAAAPDISAESALALEKFKENLPHFTSTLRRAKKDKEEYYKKTAKKVILIDELTKDQELYTDLKDGSDKLEYEISKLEARLKDAKTKREAIQEQKLSLAKKCSGKSSALDEMEAEFPLLKEMKELADSDVSRVEERLRDFKSKIIE